MGAIAGYSNQELSLPINIVSERMMSHFECYPSDHIGNWFDKTIFIGCVSQWITPEDIGLQQPNVSGFEKKIVLAADAILDNRSELFERLSLRNWPDRVITDSELILLSYEKWGESCPDYLIGDFAFMLWDTEKQQWFGARDFSGNRTLYYTQSEGMFAFCTLIRPLLHLTEIDSALNEQWVAEFLANPGRIETMDPNSTVFQCIKQLPPFHSITVKDGRTTIKRYGEIKPENIGRLSDAEHVEAFKERFSTAVTSRLRTHRQVGSFLSGGLDSGAVAAFAAKELRLRGKQLHSFSYIPLDDFEDWTTGSRLADERPYIKSTVEFSGNIRDSYFSFADRSPLSDIDQWLETLEMPYKFIENSYWLSGIFEKAEVSGVGVLLNGGRGNYTLSWGPALDYYAQLMKQFRFLDLYKEISCYSKNRGIGRKKLLSLIKSRAFPSRGSARPLTPLEQMINPEFAATTNIYEGLAHSGVYKAGAPSSTMFEARSRQFEQVIHWTNSGVSGTKLSLKHKVWYRDPTNDRRLVEFCLGLPVNQFVKDGMDRAMVRRATQGLLPDRVRLNYNIRGIQGADGILRMKDQWLQFLNEMEQLCKDPQMAVYMNIPMIQRAISENRKLPEAHAVYGGDFAMMMRALVLYRFINKVKGGEIHEQTMEQAISGSS
ncbi:asparagine synthase-related protein [Paenibacillus herberti]|uniref:asparagine synthase (glutamine-hydrolyzing) n=1 Tax=Paenibacillus herberti TaxID=1619309 RepID=A0A229NV06_9BACL|nr:asparagine synthase-related protein [Paenibacillus herberti]OXM13708.1 asparagine synthetase B [Paenibacillus herberti]